MESLLAALGGLALGWLLGWLLALRRRPRIKGWQGPGLSQLLGWIDDAPSGWLILDPADTIQWINPRAERLLPLPGALKLHRSSLLQVFAAPELQALVHNARRRERVQRLEWRLGDQEMEVFALPGERGWMALLLLSRRSIEAQLEQQERWVSDVAHELKTPLTALLLVGDSLSAQVNPGNAVLVERLQRELLRLQQLVGDLLELSRLENTLPGEGRPHQEVELSQLVQQVWAGVRPLAERRNIALELESAPAQGAAADPCPRVRGDASRLHRALLNLLDNAVRHSPDGGTVRVGLQALPPWCLITVRDEGAGLSQEDLEHMFERFYRGDPSRVRSRQAGSGLGLSIVQQIAVTHGGRVQAGNHPEGGALLELLLPMAG
jgi:two-component system, OmpR family, phosphate regulon sensor histidine kinase PhoR